MQNAGPLLPPGEPLEDFEDYEQLPETGLPQTALAPAQVTRVSTAMQLLSAVAAGARDIRIVAHIDLFEAPTDDLGFIMALQPTTRSIRVQFPPPPTCAAHADAPPTAAPSV